MLTAQGVPALENHPSSWNGSASAAGAFWLWLHSLNPESARTLVLALDLQPLKPSTISCSPAPPSPVPFTAHTPLLLSTAPKNAAHTFLAPKENIREWVYFLQIALCSEISQARNKEHIMSNWNSCFWGFQCFSKFRVKWILRTNSHLLDCQLWHSYFHWIRRGQSLLVMLSWWCWSVRGRSEMLWCTSAGCEKGQGGKFTQVCYFSVHLRAPQSLPTAWFTGVEHSGWDVLGRNEMKLQMELTYVA